MSLKASQSPTNAGAGDRAARDDVDPDAVAGAIELTRVRGVHQMSHFGEPAGPRPRSARCVMHGF